jgi:hypothetical protein
MTDTERGELLHYVLGRTRPTANESLEHSRSAERRRLTLTVTRAGRWELPEVNVETGTLLLPEYRTMGRMRKKLREGQL